jgi:hypothetical protein
VDESSIVNNAPQSPKPLVGNRLLSHKSKGVPA